MSNHETSGTRGSGDGCGHVGGCRCEGRVIAVPSTVLSKLRPGQIARVCEACIDSKDAAMLRAMGLRPNARIRVCRVGQPCIIEVMAGGCDGDEGACNAGSPAAECACRIGLARPLAEKVVVDRVEERDGRSAGGTGESGEK